MKRQIRQSCFETNSSSTHAICIATSTKYEIPDSVCFSFGEFGWSYDKLTSKRERANYLYTALAYIDDWDKIKEYLKFIVDTLVKYGVADIDFENFEISVYAYGGEVESYIKPKDYNYINHGDETRSFVDAVCTNETLLLDYLFSDKSFIITGNDNDDTDVKIKVGYPHEEYYKWN